MGKKFTLSHYFKFFFMRGVFVISYPCTAAGRLNKVEKMQQRGVVLTGQLAVATRRGGRGMLGVRRGRPNSGLCGYRAACRAWAARA